MSLPSIRDLHRREMGKCSAQNECQGFQNRCIACRPGSVSPPFMSVTLGQQRETIGESGRRGTRSVCPRVDVRFSNRPLGVKRFQTIHQYSVDVARGLALFFGFGTEARVRGFFSQEV